MKKDNKIKAVLKRFSMFGFEVVKNSEHLKLRHADGRQTVVPNHRLVKGSTLSDSIKIAGLDKNEFFSGL